MSEAQSVGVTEQVVSVPHPFERAGRLFHELLNRTDGVDVGVRIRQEDDAVIVSVEDLWICVHDWWTEVYVDPSDEQD